MGPYANLSPFLAFSVIGVCRLACLPDSALARESSGARLAPTEEPVQTEDSSKSGILPSAQGTDLWRAVDAALTCQEGTNLYRRRTIVDRLARILSQFGSMSEGECLGSLLVHRVGQDRNADDKSDHAGHCDGLRSPHRPGASRENRCRAGGPGRPRVLVHDVLGADRAGR